MIPKKLHFTWFSNDPYPELIANCMKTWEEFLPDYEIIHWDMNRIREIDNPFLQEALKCKKWAFAADFVRLYALYQEGGIYLDTDVEVFKSFDPLLKCKAFIGRENSYHVLHRRGLRYLTSHCMGAEKNHPFIKACLDYYTDRHFILSEQQWLPDILKYDQTILPFIQTEIAKLQGYQPSDSVKGLQIFGDEVKVYPFDYFDCFKQKKVSYCRHLAMGGWRNRGTKSFSFSNIQKLKKSAVISVSNLINKCGVVIFKKL